MRTLAFITLFTFMASAQKSTPPPPVAPRPFDFPKAATRTLANGLRIYVIEDHRLPLVSSTLDLLAGSAYQAPEKAGLASLTATLLREGTSTRSSQDIAKAVDNTGGSLSAGAGDDVATVNMTFMKSFAGLGMELMADIVRRPAFAQEEIGRQMQQAQSNLAVNYANPEYLAPLAASRAILGTHPYAYPTDGTPDTLRKIKREDIVAFYQATYAPARAWIAVAGDVTPAEAFALVEKHFGDWKAEAPADVKFPAPPERKARVLIVDMPNAVQTQIVVGQTGVARNHPDYIALQLANQVFGGSFNSRLNMKLRANEGLTYGANSGFDPNRQAGTFEASTFTRTEKTFEAVEMIVNLLKEFRANPATEVEFNEAKAYMIGSFGVGTETASAVAGRVLTAAVYGLGEDFYPTYRARLQALTREQVVEALRRFLDPEKLSVVAVGNAKEFRSKLEAFGPTQVVKGDAVDFVAAELEKKQAAVQATPEGAAKAKALLEAAIQATGGKEKLLAVKDQVSKGKLKLTLPQGAMDADTEETLLYPDRYKMVMSLPMGVVTQAVDAGGAWMAQGSAAEDLPPNLATELAKSVQTGGGGLGLLQLYALGKAQAQLISADTVLWKAGDFEARLGFDATTHLLVKAVYQSVGMMGPAEMEVVQSDFRSVDGLLLPYREELAQNGQKMGERTVSERKLNSGVSAAVFQKK